jgi:3-phytase
MRFISRLLYMIGAGGVALLLFPASAQTPVPQTIRPVLGTEPVANDPDDPAIWRNAQNPDASLILGTNKASAADGGALYVFNLEGKIQQVVKDLDRPNNVDVKRGMRLKNGSVVDIAVVTERNRKQLRVFYVQADGVKPAGNIPVFTGEAQEDFSAPMGIALYKRPTDGTVFAMVTRKSGPKTGYVWQYRLEDNGRGGITGTKVRAFGNFSGDGEIEAIAVDDELGYVYYCDEIFGIRKWHADPNHKEARKELAVFAKTGYRGDREGVGIFTRPDGTGYLVTTDQIEGNSVFYVYKREGEPGRPHDHTKPIAVFKGGADDTDGIEVTSASMGVRFPEGLLIAMNSGKKNFLFYDWRDIRKGLK